MEFINSQSSFTIEVLGYEFEDSEYDEDLNWLDVLVNASLDGNGWSRQGAYLRTDELLEIKSLIESSVSQEKLDFLENDLSFSRVDNTIRVHLNYNLHPKGDAYDYKSDEEVILEFELSSKDEILAIEKLNSWIANFPNRP